MILSCTDYLNIMYHIIYCKNILQLASELCSNGTPPGAIITIAAYMSVCDIVRDLKGSLIVPYLADMITNRWNSIARINNVTCPCLFIHGGALNHYKRCNTYYNNDHSSKIMYMHDSYYEYVIMFLQFDITLDETIPAEHSSKLQVLLKFYTNNIYGFLKTCTILLPAKTKYKLRKTKK